MIMNDWQSREEEEQRVKIEKIGSDKGKKNKERKETKLKVRIARFPSQ